MRALRPRPTGHWPAACACAALLGAALFAACGAPRPADAAPLADPGPAPEPIVLYLARRSWHIDVGFAVRDLSPSLAFIAQRFPRAKYLFFGFGDRHYLLSKGKGTSTLAGALFPGAGLILVTSIENLPAQAFGRSQVLEFALSAPQAAAAQRFVRRALAGGEGGGEVLGDISPVGEGPYEGSAYYAAVPRYSALHTCNTWAAEALKAAGLSVRTHLVLFAGQLWNQARKIDTQAMPRSTALEGVITPQDLAHAQGRPCPRLCRYQSQGGGLPFWQTTVVVEPCGTTTVVFCGGGGLELLIHPANKKPAATMALKSAFMSTPDTAKRDRMSQA